jgi:translation initiation factor 4E
MAEELFLDESWNLYFHNPDDNDWTNISYKMIGTISTVDDWCKANLAFSELWHKGMFFLMKDGIMPQWEDISNKKGGCFSFKVNKPESSNYWFKMSSLVLSNTLGKDQNINDNITGISISPKRNYCILRLWLGSHKFNVVQHYNLEIPQYTQIMYKSHMENNDFTLV